jgi:hypothetical protein
MTVAAIPQATGDWSIRGRDADQVFASSQLSDTALSAAVRVTARFDPSFPGWELYRRVVAGVGLFDRRLEAWAVTNARMLSRMTKKTPAGQLRPYIGDISRSKPGWIAQAGRDALDFAIYKRYPSGLNERGDRFGVREDAYQAIRDPVAAGMCIGLETFASELHAEYFRVRRIENGMD